MRKNIKKSGRGGTRTLDLTDVNRLSISPNRRPHGYPVGINRAPFSRSIRVPFGWNKSYTICINTI